MALSGIFKQRAVGSRRSAYRRCRRCRRSTFGVRRLRRDLSDVAKPERWGEVGSAVRS